MVFWKKCGALSAVTGIATWACVNGAVVTTGLTQGNLIALSIVCGLVAFVSGIFALSSHPNT